MITPFPIPEGYYTVVAYILAGVVGLCVGSFLNVVIYRVPEKMSLAFPSSHCPKCGYVLKWYDNIPIVSYCMLGGKCRSCKDGISFRYTAVEAANMLLWLLCAFLYRDDLAMMLISMIVTSVGICVFFIDVEHMIIPDRFQIILGVCGILAVFFDTYTVWYSHLIGMAAGFLVFLGVGIIGSKVLGREALGGGDVKLAAVSGLLLGWEKFLLMMLIASVSGSVVMLIRRMKSGESRETAFGPFLVAGLLISLFAGEYVIGWYFSLLVH